MLALAGVISVESEHGVCFHKATRLDVRDAEALARTLQLRVLRWFARRGLLDPSAAADMRTWRGTGGCFASSMLSVFDGSVDGSVRIEAEDRAGLERLVRYCARGPLLRSAGPRPEAGTDRPPGSYATIAIQPHAQPHAQLHAIGTAPGPDLRGAPGPVPRPAVER